MQKAQWKSLCLVMIAAVVVMLTACPAREDIARVNHDPGRFAGREITLAGRVSNSFGAMGNGVFEIEDGTGKMWVFTDRFGIPGRDARVAVTGRIEQGFSFHGHNYALVLRETRRRHDAH
ncbi:MAG TPA: OB-fold nucleic acid binding domain-containing protein [Terriglobales bacterium]